MSGRSSGTVQAHCEALSTFLEGCVAPGGCDRSDPWFHQRLRQPVTGPGRASWMVVLFGGRAGGRVKLVIGRDAAGLGYWGNVPPPPV